MGRRLASGVAAVTVLLLITGCSDEKDPDAAETSSTTTSVAEEEATTTSLELSDEEFEGATDDFGGQVESAAGNFCELMAASAFSPEAAPANSEQVKVAVDEVLAYFRALSQAEGVDEATSSALNSLADDLQSAAEASGYSTDFLNSQQTTELFQSADYVNAMGALLARSEQECGQASPSGGG